MTEIQIQRALPEHGRAISQLKNSIWPHETTDSNYCTRIIAEPDHITHVAMIDQHVVGFVDGFLTYAPDGDRRWEVDLLAVAESARHQGIAQQLITENLSLAKSTWPIDYARSLIQTGNYASQQTFTTCQFVRVDAQQHKLYTTSPDKTELKTAINPKAFLIPVSTLSYQGLWLEGEITLETLMSARAILHKHHLSTAGLLIPTTNAEQIAHAEQAGYGFVNTYHYWYQQF